MYWGAGGAAGRILAAVKAERISELRAAIEALAADASRLRKREGKAVDEVIALLDEGRLRVAEPTPSGWVTNAWVKQAILLYFQRMDTIPIGPAIGDGDDAPRHRSEAPSYYDKLPTKRNYKKLGARCVPGGVARYGSYLGKNTILMPGFVNIGAYVDDGSMVDTWATVGSGAQIGADVHLAGGVGIGGVLEPPGARPVIIEDGVFVGSRAAIVEGVVVGEQAVIGPHVTLGKSIPLIDVTGDEPVEHRGVVPPRAVVVPGTRPKEFPAGTFQLACALIIGWRSESTDLRVSLNDALREHGLGA